jgi:phosphoserine phosphatase
VSEHRLLVVLDVDSTLTRDEGIDLLAGFVSEAVAAEVADITAAAMRGQLDFVESLQKRVRALEGVPYDAVVRASDRVTLTQGARELVDTLRAEGHLVGAVSGGFHDMIDGLAEDLGLDFHRANRLEVRDSVLTGNLVGPIIDAKAKADTVAEWAQANGIPMSQTVAIGDGGNDVMMLAQAGLGIAFMAKPVAIAAADVSIDEPNLAEVLGLLGFPRD